jgi:hypothetical protein
VNGNWLPPGSGGLAAPDPDAPLELASRQGAGLVLGAIRTDGIPGRARAMRMAVWSGRALAG